MNIEVATNAFQKPMDYKILIFSWTHTKQWISENHIYNDYASGEKDERPGLQARLQALRQVDTLVV